MQVRQAFPANPQPAELLQPAQRPLDRPADAAQVVRVVRTALGNVGVDPHGRQQVAGGLAVVAFVRRHAARSVERPAGFAADRRELQEHQREELTQVMQVGGRE